MYMKSRSTGIIQVSRSRYLSIENIIRIHVTYLPVLFKNLEIKI